MNGLFIGMNEMDDAYVGCFLLFYGMNGLLVGKGGMYGMNDEVNEWTIY